MFLFKCCSNHSSESRRPAFSHHSKKQPIQVFIKTSVKSVTHSPKNSNRSEYNTDTDGDRRLNGKVDENDLCNKYLVLLKSGSVTEIDKLAKQANESDVGEDKKKVEDGLTLFLNEVEKSLKYSPGSPTTPHRIIKNRTTTPCTFSRFGVVDHAINKNHHQPHNRHHLNQRCQVTNSCLALLTEDNRIVTSLVKKSNSVHSSRDSREDRLHTDRVNFNIGNEDLKSHNLTLYSLNDLHNYNRSENCNQFSDITTLSGIYFDSGSSIKTPAVDNHVEILYKNRQFLNLNNREYLSVLIHANALTRCDTKTDRMRTSPIGLIFSNGEEDTVQSKKELKNNNTLSNDNYNDESNSYQNIKKKAKPIISICDATTTPTTTFDNTKASSPNTNYYSSFESDLWLSTTASSDYAATSITTATTTNPSNDGYESYGSKPSDFSLTSSSFELISNDSDIESSGNRRDDILDDKTGFENKIHYYNLNVDGSGNNCFDDLSPDVSTIVESSKFESEDVLDDVRSVVTMEKTEVKESIDIGTGDTLSIPNYISDISDKLNSIVNTTTIVNDKIESENVKPSHETSKQETSDSSGLFNFDASQPDQPGNSDNNDENISQTQWACNEINFLMNENSATYLDCLVSSEINVQNTAVDSHTPILARDEEEKDGDDDEEEEEEEGRVRPIFESTDWDDSDNDVADNYDDEDYYCNDINADDRYPTFDLVNVQPQTRDLESYFISEPSDNQKIHIVSLPGTTVRNIDLYNNVTEKKENEQGVTNSNNPDSNSDSMKSIKSLYLADKKKNKSLVETDEKIRTKNNSVLDFQRFYSKSTPNLNSDVDKRKSSLTLVEEYFNKYIIDCETNDVEDVLTGKIGSSKTGEGSNVDPNSSSDSSPQEISTGGIISLKSGGENVKNQSLDKFSEICKKFSSTCLNIFQTSYPALHTTSDSCPSISNLTLDSSQSEYNNNPKSHSQSAATLSALYAAIFPAFGAADDAASISEPSSNHRLAKETSVDDQVLIGKPASIFKKPNLVRRSLSLKAPENIPTAEVRKKKKVKFADAFGLELAIVRMILSGENLTDQAFQQRFQAASASYHNNFTNHTNNNAHNNSTNRSSCLKNTNERSKVKPEMSKTTNNQTVPSKKIVADFIQPGNSEDFSTKVWMQSVLLESCLPEKKSNSISGCIRVYNLTYGKEIIVRYTMNNWTSFNEYKASYIYGSNDGNSDRFSFMINLPPYFDVGSVFEFAILYRTDDGREFWDNNHGHNYRMICQKC